MAHMLSKLLLIRILGGLIDWRLLRAELVSASLYYTNVGRVRLDKLKGQRGERTPQTQ